MICSWPLLCSFVLYVMTILCAFPVLQELGPEGCHAVWQKLCASGKGQLLNGIERESFASALITCHGDLFTVSEKDKFNDQDRNWKVCKEMVQEALARNPRDVLRAFYKALIATQTSGGATQHAEIARKMTSSKCSCIYGHA